MLERLYSIFLYDSFGGDIGLSGNPRNQGDSLKPYFFQFVELNVTGEYN